MASTIYDALLKTDEEKFTYLKRKEERKQQKHNEINEDMAFFHSILPHVKGLDAKKRMKFRISVLQLLDSEISDTTTNNYCYLINSTNFLTSNVESQFKPQETYSYKKLIPNNL